MKILGVVGARPNFIKISPLAEEIKKHSQVELILVHTGQHYNVEMSKLFFKELNIPDPDYNLEIGSGSHAFQTGKAMVKLEKILLKEKPDLVLVVGDANACLIGALTASKIHIPVVHVEAGLRSFDMSMPEEINRRLTDHISDYLFTTEKSGNMNLLNEGISKDKIYFVGNIMIDTLKKSKSKINNLNFLKTLNLEKKKYAVLTLHRSENVDNKEIFKEILSALEKIQKKTKIIWPIHPRTRKQIEKFRLSRQVKNMKNLFLINPLGYLEMLSLNNHSIFVLTDSGGIQEETTFLKIPCLTIRKNTERPVTVKDGTNKIIGLKSKDIINETNKILSGRFKKGKVPQLWDGRTSERILKILLSLKK